MIVLDASAAVDVLLNIGASARIRSRIALNRLSTMGLTRHPHTPFIERIWELKENITAYDAAYIALAETLDAPLTTTDGRLAHSSGHGAKVELYE